jgi:phage repressor protein C with HTH and peptisase S24 domain
MKLNPLKSKSRIHFYKVWPLYIFRVSGDSMSPSYQPGDTLLGWSWFIPMAGQVVIAEREGMQIIKRVESVSDVQIWLIGDNLSRSTDSRIFGPLSKNTLKAKIIAKL